VVNAKHDHFDFINKMRERDVGIIEFHNLPKEMVKIR